MGLIVKTKPASEPVSLSEVKDFMRYTEDDADTYITDILIPAARRAVESFIRRALITQTWYFYFDDFDNRKKIEIPFPPVTSITEVKYLASGDTVNDWDNASVLADSNYFLDLASNPQTLALTEGGSWPSVQDVPNSVRVEFVTGYATAADIPEDMKQGVLLLCSHFFQNREIISYASAPLEIPQMIKLLLAPYKIFYF